MLITEVSGVTLEPSFIWADHSISRTYHEDNVQLASQGVNSRGQLGRKQRIRWMVAVD
jgi:hypothetical protein